MGTGTTNVAASRRARNSVGIEVDPHYFAMARRRVETHADDLFAKCSVIAKTIDRYDSGVDGTRI